MTPEIVRSISKTVFGDEMAQMNLGVLTHDLVTTSGALALNVAVREIPENYNGMLIADVIALVTDGSALNVGRYAVKFRKSTTITIGTKAVIFEDNDNAATVNFVNDSENIAVEGGGIASTDITWLVRTQLLMTNTTVLP